MTSRFVAVVAAALCIGSSAFHGAPALADDPTPPPAPVAGLDPYVRTAIDLLTGIVTRQIQNNRNGANGEVSYFRRFEMQVQTGTNSYRAVHLHQGTVIDPRGKSLEPGQRVSVGGIAQSDGSLDADVITILQ
jgi:hypothetical protein